MKQINKKYLPLSLMLFAFTIALIFFNLTHIETNKVQNFTKIIEQQAVSQLTNTINDISVGVYVLNIWGANTVSGSFKADFYIWMAWAKTFSYQNTFEFMNLANNDITIEAMESFNHKGREYRSFRVRGDFLFEVDLFSYPFDYQVFSIVIEDANTTTDQMNYVFDYRSSKIDDLNHVSDWFVKKAYIERTTHNYNSFFGDTRYELDQSHGNYSQIAISFSAERQSIPYMLKSFIPLMLIFLVVTLIFFIDTSRIDSRTAICISTLFAEIGLQMTVSHGLPNVGYLTRMDMFFVVSYAYIALCTLQMVWTSKVVVSDLQQAENINAMSALIFPALYSVIIFWLCYPFLSFNL